MRILIGLAVACLFAIAIFANYEKQDKKWREKKDEYNRKDI